MRVLYYTVVLGTAISAVNVRMRQPAELLRLDAALLGSVRMGDIEIFRQKGRIEEFVNIHDYDAVCHLEADVDCAYDPMYSPDSITVERGDWPISRFGRPSEETTPWNGLIWIPRPCYGAFFPAWKKEWAKHGVEHRYEELTLLDSLTSSGCPWSYAEDIGFAPTDAPITHHRGIQAKRQLVPEYSLLYGDDLENYHDSLKQAA